tara:strand:- start:263 stop:1897 length:1635 start_codon:yes stop_codon:yes gene_type:complete
MAISLGGFSGGGGGASTDTLDDVTGRGATTTNAVTVGGLSIGTAYTMPTSDGSANQVLSTDGSGSILFSTLNITGGLEYKGAFNATAGTPSIANAEKGDFYIIDTAGTIYGQTWGVGDHLLINENMGGSVTNSKIDKIDNTDAVSSVNGQTGPVSLGVGNLSDVTITGAANGEVLKYDGSAWVDATLAYSEISGTPTNISTFTNDSNYLTAITGQSIGSLSDVTITSAANGQVISYNGSAWVNSAASAGSLAGLSDVTITGAANGEVLKYDGSAWVDATLAYSEISGTPTNVSDFTNDSNYLTAITGQSIGSLSDVTITGAANGEYLRYNGSAWVDAALGIADDTSPSLGGNLDVSGNDIISASNGAIEIAPDGTGSVIIKGNTAASATNTGHIKLNCENNSHHVKIAAPAHAAISAGGSYTLTLPADDGDANEVLQTDGSGNLSWVAQSGGSGGGFTYSAISSTTPAQAQYHYSCTGTFTLTLPAASGITAGEEIRVKNMGTGTITIDRSSTDTIDAQASITLGVQYQMLSFVSNGSNGYEVI